MLNIGSFKQGFTIGMMMLIRRILPATIAVAALRATMLAYNVPMSDHYVVLLIVTGLLAFILFPIRIKNEFSDAESLGNRVIATVTSWLILFGIMLLLGYVTKSSAIYSRRVLITWFVVAPVLILSGRILIFAIFWRILVHSTSERRAIIAGASENGRSLAARIAATPGFRVAVDGFFEDRSRDRLGVGPLTNILGRLKDIPEYVHENKTDIIFIAVPINNIQRVTELLDALHDTTASIYFVPDVFVFDLIQCRTVDIGGIPAVALCETPFFGFRGVTKRISDIVIATLGLIITSPIMLATAILIKLTSEGPIIFGQRRYGLDGREITVYKFRSMTVCEDGGQIRQAEQGDSRLTPIGDFIRKYSIDELPQLINVLQGRMSVVGPRPHAVAHNEEYRKIIKGYMVRHKVTPGITGLAQVNGFRGETKTLDLMENRIALDLDYLRNWSIALDLKIILKTAARVFSDSKAY